MDVAPKNIRDLGNDLKKEYNSLGGTNEVHMLQGLQSIIELQMKKRDLKSMLREVIMILHRLFPFREISIGIKSPSDGLYRYIEVLGLSPVAKDEHMKLSYTYDQMRDQAAFPYVRISKYTDFRYAEGEQVYHESEEKAFSRPSMLNVPRKTNTEMLEADYFDIYLLSQKDDLIGWIELAKSEDNLMPSMRIIRWLEMFALAISPYVERELQNMKLAEFGRQH